MGQLGRCQGSKSKAARKVPCPDDFRNWQIDSSSAMERNDFLKKDTAKTLNTIDNQAEYKTYTSICGIIQFHFGGTHKLFQRPLSKSGFTTKLLTWALQWMPMPKGGHPQVHSFEEHLSDHKTKNKYSTLLVHIGAVDQTVELVWVEFLGEWLERS